ncbi:type I toxin-antitoxin system Ibs family toxin [Escherichia marmotae]|nr:type I toxin-antitoxin system Ibs family toxin [Escherichia marmotae]AUT29820.1 hypothetical protein C1192_01540 [Escherichia marmotae]
MILVILLVISFQAY